MSESAYKTRSCCVVDNGLFVELAVLLSESFGQVWYYAPWESEYPKSNQLLIGSGIPGVTRADDVFGIMEDVDLWVFPDVYHGSLQLHLEDLGKRVWGSRMGEELELFREDSKRHLKSLGLPVGPYVVVEGIDALRSYLRTHENQWVKISRTRGDMETFHSLNYQNIEPRLDELEYQLGAKKSAMRFVVEEGIDEAVEIGYDGYTVDGVFPSRAMFGIEIKDKGYVGAFLPYEQMPPQIRETNARLSDTLRSFRYRNFFSAEMRVTANGTPWIIDPCARFGSPPGELAMVMYENIPEILWEGAAGKLIEPQSAGPCGAELLFHSTWADKNWQAVQFPEEIRRFVKLRNFTMIHDRYYIAPQCIGLPEIGAVVAVGPSLEEAIQRVQELAELVQGYYIDVFPGVLDDAEEQFERVLQWDFQGALEEEEV